MYNIRNIHVYFLSISFYDITKNKYITYTDILRLRMIEMNNKLNSSMIIKDYFFKHQKRFRVFFLYLYKHFCIYKALFVLLQILYINDCNPEWQETKIYKLGGVTNYTKAILLVQYSACILLQQFHTASYKIALLSRFLR